MAARTPKVVNAAIELAFVFAAGVFGVFKAPWWWLFLLADVMIGYWFWNRRVDLKQLEAMGAQKLATAAAISVLLMGAVLTGAYWIGTLFSG